MNAEGLLARYARIADAPNAIARLRRLVLNLAVRGRLVTTEPGDEPATALLERISSENARLTEQGKFKEPRSLVAINRGNLPFAPPSHWAWARLIEISRPSYGFAFASSKFNSSGRGMPLIRIRDISKADTEAYFDGPYDTAYVVKAGDYLVGMDGDFNLRRWRGKDGLLNQRVMRINDWKCGVNPEFVKLPLQFVLDYLHGKTSLTTVKHLSAKQVNGIEIPLPPVAEQQRIVSKVDELMALCDQLEAARARREATRDRLAAASLARLNTPDPDTFPADARFALDALPALTTRPDQIKQLRQTVLNLAVRGKLVGQDPTDEPASELLSRITNQKSLMVKAGSIKTEKPVPFPSEGESPDLPAGWAKVRLGALSKIVTSGSRDWAKHYSKEGAIFIRMGNLSKDDYRLRLDHIQRVNPPSDGEGTRTRLEGGDILVSITGEVGMLGLIPDDFGEAYINQHTAMVRPMPELKGRYLAEFLRSSIAKDQFNAPQRGIKNSFRLSDVTELEIPLPPLAEQHRIVAKLDELMALCDQLEASLTTSESTRSRLLDALLHEALAPAPRTHVEHPRAAVSGYLVSRLASKRNFGRTAHMKHLYLAESRLGLKLGGRYMREAAGPLDNGIYALEKQAEVADWYSAHVETLPSGKEKVSYMPGKALKALAEEGVAVLGLSRAEMDRLIDLMGGLKTEQVEIIATLFAAWNDALLDGHTPDDNWIVEEVREHWHVSKQRFKPADLKTWLAWMRQNDVIPLGHPPRTMQQTTMEL